jgi:hypothetical protein
MRHATIALVFTILVLIVGCSAPATPEPVVLAVEGVEVENGQAVITGHTNPDVLLEVNGQPVEVDDEGRFTAVVSLEMGTNFVGLTATAHDGRQRTEVLTVPRRTAAPGEEAALGGVTFRLVETLPLTTTLGSEPLTARAGGAFLVLYLEVTNERDEPVTLRETDFVLVDGEGNEYGASPEGAFARQAEVPEEQPLNGVTLPPGSAVTGYLVFDVGPEVEVEDLTLYAYNPLQSWATEMSLKEGRP